MRGVGDDTGDQSAASAAIARRPGLISTGWAAVTALAVAALLPALSIGPAWVSNSRMVARTLPGTIAPVAANLAIMLAVACTAGTCLTRRAIRRRGAVVTVPLSRASIDPARILCPLARVEVRVGNKEIAVVLVSRQLRVLGRYRRNGWQGDLLHQPPEETLRMTTSGLYRDRGTTTIRENPSVDRRSCRVDRGLKPSAGFRFAIMRR